MFENGTPEQWCRWRDDLNRAWKGLNNTNGPNRANTVRHLLEGQALDDFEQFFMPADVHETVDNVDLALKKVAANIFPADAVMNMKHYLNFELKKPNKLTARETMTRLERINKWIGDYFPSDGGDRTLPVERIEAGDLKLIYYRSLPDNWRRKMVGATRRALPLRKMAIRAMDRTEVLRAVPKRNQLTAVETGNINPKKRAIATYMGPIAGTPVISARS